MNLADQKVSHLPGHHHLSSTRLFRGSPVCGGKISKFAKIKNADPNVKTKAFIVKLSLTVIITKALIICPQAQGFPPHFQFKSKQ